jgi:hypothetical protein
MIQLHPDCLIFQTSSGENIPCSAEVVTVELVGEATLDPEIVREAASAVVYYFKVELGRDNVSIEEFSRALERVLIKLGYEVTAGEDVHSSSGFGEAELPQVTLNLPELASACGKGFELIFFQRLRTELREQLRTHPRSLRFQGLRTCVKQLTGARRWTERCQKLNDQIVDYLRECYAVEGPADCNLVVV